MLSLDQMRKIDPKLADISDADLEVLRTDLYGTAQLAFDLWYGEREAGSVDLDWERAELEAF